MIRRQRSGKNIVLLAMLFALYLGGSVWMYAAESNGGSDKQGASDDGGQPMVFGADTPPREKPDPGMPDAATPFGLFAQVIVFLFLLAAMAVGIIRYIKKGTFSLGKLKPIGTENRLLILETKMLGGRQYLTVVEYNEQKMLLGVSQGRIEQLCFLESVYEEEAREAELEQDRD